MDSFVASLADHERARITWAAGAPHIKYSNPPPVAELLVCGQRVRCPLVGIGQSRIVYGLGSKYVFKHEYNVQIGKKEQNAKELALCARCPAFIANVQRTVEGDLIAKAASYTLHHLLLELSRSASQPAGSCTASQPAASSAVPSYLHDPERMNNILESFFDWLHGLATFASTEGIRLQDLSSKNVGFDGKIGRAHV